MQRECNDFGGKEEKDQFLFWEKKRTKKELRRRILRKKGGKVSKSTCQVTHSTYLGRKLTCLANPSAVRHVHTTNAGTRPRVLCRYDVCGKTATLVGRSLRTPHLIARSICRYRKDRCVAALGPVVLERKVQTDYSF